MEWKHYHRLTTPYGTAMSIASDILADDEVVDIDYSRWIWQVLGWDIVLPIVIFVAPQVAELFLAKNDMNCGLYVIFLAIPLFFLRVCVGSAAIQANHCRPVVRGIQMLCLIGVALWLLLVDSLSLALHDLAPDLHEMLLLKGAGLGISWPFMIFAMYPGLERRRLATTFNTCGRCGAMLQTATTFVCKTCASGE